MLTRKQHELLSFIQQRLEANGISPSFEEMKDALDLRSKSGVHRLVSALEERGFIRRLPNRARALEVLKSADNRPTGQPAPASATVTSIDTARRARAAGQAAAALSSSVVEIPMHGRIAAGLPIEALEGQDMLPVPAALLGTGEHYALEVSGDSMVDAGILDGDLALVQRADSARDGEIVVALVRGEEATLKYLRRENGMIRLDPANATYQSQYYRPDEVQVQGRLTGLLRRYH